LISFASLYLAIKLQLVKEQKRFSFKFGLLSAQKVRVAKKQNINKEILVNNLNSQI
jgi:hypothetical protein